MNDNLRSILSQRRNAFAESENTDTDYERDNLLRDCTDQTNFCAGCCNPIRYGQKPKFKRDSYAMKPPRSDLRHHVKSPYSEELEMKVMNEEVIERELSEKQLSSRQQMEDVCELLRSLVLYAQCLDTKQKLAKRLRHLLDKILPRKSEFRRPVKDSSNWNIVSDQIKEIMAECGEETDVPDSYYEMLCDCNDKYRDFIKASSNFCQILKQQNGVSSSQLRKLEKQYEEIRANYSESKANLNSQMDQLIETRIRVVDRCLHSLGSTLSQTIECDKEIFNWINDLSLTEVIIKPPAEKKSSHRSLNGKLYRQVVGQPCDLDKCTCGPTTLGGRC